MNTTELIDIGILLGAFIGYLLFNEMEDRKREQEEIKKRLVALKEKWKGHERES